MKDSILHKNSSRLKSDGTSVKSLTSEDIWPGSEHTTDYNLSLDRILKIILNSKHIKLQVEA